MANQDLRIVKTKLSLEKALLKLLRKKKLKDIQIKELTEEAMVSRQTFYTHYELIEELFEDCVARILREMKEEDTQFIESFEGELEPYNVDHIANGFQSYKNHQEEFAIILRISDKDLIMKSLHNHFWPDILFKEEIYEDEVVFKNAKLHFIGGLYQLLKEWILNNPDMSAREFAEIYKKVVLGMRGN